MANAAFCKISSLGPSGDGKASFTVCAECTILDATGNVVSNSSASSQHGFLATIAQIQAALIQNLRDNAGDQTIVVTFVGG